MIHAAAIGYVLGQFLLVLAATMAVPVGWGLVRVADGVLPLVLAGAITGGAGLALVLGLPRPRAELTRREGLLLVVATWVAVSIFGALPFYLSPWFDSFTDAVFEATSGFTTTGATVLADVEVLPEPLQFWRCFTHWLGGMGIVLLGVAVLPLVGHGGMQLYRAEFSGAEDTHPSHALRNGPEREDPVLIRGGRRGLRISNGDKDMRNRPPAMHDGPRERPARRGDQGHHATIVAGRRDLDTTRAAAGVYRDEQVP